MGYVDSANLYTFAGGDPVNRRDPLGEEAAYTASGGVYITNPRSGARYLIPKKDAEADPVALQDLLIIEGGLTAQQTKDFMQEMGLEYTHPYQRAVVRPNLPKGKDWVKNAVIATSGLPPQNRQQEIVQGALQIAGTAVMVVGGTYANARTVSASPVEVTGPVKDGFKRYVEAERNISPESTPAEFNVLPGQAASTYPFGRRVGGRGESVRPTDPPGGVRESGAFDLTPENVRLMESGRPPIGRDGLPVELHHRGQNPAGPLDEMTSTSHDLISHPVSPSRIDRGKFAGERARYWRERVRVLHGQR
jgi:HNH/ENDO VII superfamily nuclease